MVEYSQQRVQYEKACKKSIFQNSFLDFSIDPGGPGSHPGGSRTNPGAENHQKNENFQNYKNYNIPPKIMNINFWRAITIIIIIMAAGRQKDEF